ncbi:MAG TPA: hypothetical protein ENI29_19370, partial [bacterium]|nr:hypothetical protein [bacterium]
MGKNYMNKKVLALLITGIVIVSVVSVSLTVIFWPQAGNNDGNIDITAPTVEVTNPTNTIYTNAELLLNITVTDDNGINTVWYNWEGSNVTY